MFGWFDAILLKGWRNPLGPEDLYQLKAEDSADIINISWNKHWGKQVCSLKPIFYHSEKNLLFPKLQMCKSTMSKHYLAESVQDLNMQIMPHFRS